MKLEGAEDDHGDHRADRLLGQRGDEQAHRAQRASRSRGRRWRAAPAGARGEPDRVPESNVIWPPPKKHQPDDHAGHDDDQRGDAARRSHRGVLHAQQAGSAGRARSGGSEGAEVRLAGDRVAGDRRDRERQEQPQLDGQRRQRDEEAVAGDRAEEVGPPGPRGRVRRPRPRSRSAPGRRPARASPAMLRRRRKTGAARSAGTRVDGRPPRAVAVQPQPLTSKPSPVSATKTSSSEGVLTRNPRDRDVTGAPAPPRPSRARHRRDPHGRAGGDATSVSPSSCRTAAASAGGRSRRRARAGALACSCLSGTLGDEPADVHHADMGAHLLHLGEQVGGDQHRGAALGERLDQRPHLAGALRVETVGRLVQDEQLALPKQRAGDRRAADACRGSRRGNASCCGRSPTRSRAARCAPWPCAGRSCGRPHPAVRGCRGPTGRDGTRVPPPGRRPAAGPRRGLGIGWPRSSRVPRWARSVRAASGWWWSSRSRSGRGSHRRLPSAPQGRARRPPPGGRTLGQARSLDGGGRHHRLRAAYSAVGWRPRRRPAGRRR